MPYKKILIAVDSSEHSERAAKEGFSLAKQLKAETALVFVVDTSLAIAKVDAGISSEQALVLLKNEAEQTINKLAKIKNKVIKFMPEGNPNEDILATADSWVADLLVMGSHGNTGLLHLLMGSVTEHVTRHSKIPVMIVPAK